MAIKGKACWLLDYMSPLMGFARLFLFSDFSFSFPSPQTTHTHTQTRARVHARAHTFLLLHVLLLISLQSAFLHKASGFAPAASILRGMAVFAHKAGTLHYDVATCAMAALHNPMLRLCWLNWPAFTQAPHGCFGTLSPLPHWSGVSPFTLVAAWGFRRRGDSGLTCKPPDGIFFATWTAKWQINNTVL